MKLLIDNSEEDRAVFYLSGPDGWEKFVFPQSASPRPILIFLESLLKKRKKTVSDLSGVAVLLGRGRFTATRIAVTLANTLAYALKIPVVGVSEIDFDNLDKKFKRVKKGIYLSAEYSGEANIGRSKKRGNS